VSVSETGADRTDRYWVVLLVRALIALAVGLWITFSSDHSSPVGHLALAVLLLATGITRGVGALTTQAGLERGIFLAIAVLDLVAGAIALLTVEAEPGVLLLLIGGWAVVTGFLELFLGLRARGTRPVARDWLVAGGLTVVLAVAAFIIPVDFAQPYAIPNGPHGVVTASIMIVGALGAYAATTGVYLVIAALSLKWASAPSLNPAVTP
jgi:uncharacterized membrane protein HdeD (DUF308 family)